MKKLLLLLIPLIFACTKKTEHGLKVAATPVPHAQMLEYIKPDLAEQGINLIIIVTDDYNLPNRALADHEIDANFFQHLPFLKEQIKEFDYPIEEFAKVEIEPMGIYSTKYSTLEEIPTNGTIAIPNDPTNEARALLLLQDQGLIELDNPYNLSATVVNINQNPRNLKFIEVDAAMLPRTLTDVDAAAINTNFALEAHLSPKQALALENKDSPYVNILAIRIGDGIRSDLQALKSALTSEKMREYIIKNYRGAVIPAF